MAEQATGARQALTRGSDGSRVPRRGDVTPRAQLTLRCANIARADLGEPVRTARSELFYHCPKHDDRRPSLQINTVKNCWICGPCGAGGSAWELAAFLAGVNPDDKTDVTAWLREHGLLPGRTQPQRHIIATYSYTDDEGRELFQEVRFEPKAFRVRHRGQNGEWVYNVNGVALVPYNLVESPPLVLVDRFHVLNQRAQPLEGVLSAFVQLISGIVWVRWHRYFPLEVLRRDKRFDVRLSQFGRLP